MPAIPAGAEVPTSKYIISCGRCQQRYDAATAPWCECLEKDRTTVCPGCGNCFCSAPASFKQSFWTNAPAALWQRKLKERKTLSGAGRLEPVLTRPLVLIVDDDRGIQMIAAQAVAGLGYGYVIAENGVAGLAAARQHHPDLILTDAFMPKMDGREMCRQIKESPSEFGDPRIVIMTSLYTSAAHKYEALRQFRADLYLHKPLEFTMLQETLRDVLSERQSRAI